MITESGTTGLGWWAGLAHQPAGRRCDSRGVQCWATRVQRRRRRRRAERGFRQRADRRRPRVPAGADEPKAVPDGLPAVAHRQGPREAPPQL